MSARHLTAELWAALRHTPDDALLAHVAEGCEVCDAFLAGLPGVEGQLDRVLLSLTERAGADELAWHRFRRRSARRLSPVLAAAAVVVLSVAGALLVKAGAPGGDGSSGDKGSDGPAVVSLRAAARDGEGGLVALVPGAAVSERQTLVFRVDSTVRGAGYLFAQRGGGAPQLLEPVQLNGGVQELERDGRGLLGLALQGERGVVVVWLVASEDPLSADEARAALEEGGAARVAVSKFEVTVTP